MKITEIGEVPCHLGEGPLWDPRADRLYWVDSLGPRLFSWDFHSGQTRQWDLPGRTIGSLAVREAGGLILAMDQGFYSFTLDQGEPRLIAAPLDDQPNLRFNDGKVDPSGAFLAGAMNRDHNDDVDCSLYRLDPDLSVRPVLSGFSCANGPCFNRAGDRFYVTGRKTGAVEVFDYRDGAPQGEGAVLLEGMDPDGATVDADDYLWSAQWELGCLLRLAPDGRLDGRVDFPGMVVTSVMFGGPELDLIFVTTLGKPFYGGQPTQDASFRPGMTLMVEGSGYRGREEFFFAG